MSNSEFSDAFTTLLNSYNTQANFGEEASKREIVLDEYEKSVLLTQAQDIIVKSYFDRTLNNQGQGFDDSARRQVDFSSLIKVENVDSGGGGDTPSSSTSAQWDRYGTVTVTNRTNSTITFTLRTDTEQSQQENSIDISYSNNTLVICIVPSRLENINTITELISALNSQPLPGGGLVNSIVRLTISDADDQEALVDAYETIINAVELGPASNSQSTSSGGVTTGTKFDSRGIIYRLPYKTFNERTAQEETVSQVLFILNEKLIDTTDGNKEYVVVPISYTEYDREMSKPFAQPLKKQAWRLFQNNVTGFDIYSEVIPKFSIKNHTFTYRLRYVRRPKPIVLENLPSGLSIDGETMESQCELNPILHMDILNKAFELAVATRGGGSAVREREQR